MTERLTVDRCELDLDVPVLVVGIEARRPRELIRSARRVANRGARQMIKVAVNLFDGGHIENRHFHVPRPYLPNSLDGDDLLLRYLVTGVEANGFGGGFGGFGFRRTTVGK
jgi:hypothetical protein